MKRHYIYLLREREFIKTKENIYKIGRTCNPRNRLSSYPKGSDIKFLMECNDSHVAERDLMEIFDRLFIPRPDIGAEYYEGNSFDLLRIIGNYFFQNYRLPK
jgi:hypothetical protein